MPRSIHMRKVPDQLYARIEQLAALEGRSVSGEAVNLLQLAAGLRAQGLIEVRDEPGAEQDDDDWPAREAMYARAADRAKNARKYGTAPLSFAGPEQISLLLPRACRLAGSGTRCRCR